MVLFVVPELVRNLDVMVFRELLHLTAKSARSHSPAAIPVSTGFVAFFGRLSRGCTC